MNHTFKLVDVFHTQPPTGNPLAVIFDAEDLSTEEMQRVSRWLNLSETTSRPGPTKRTTECAFSHWIARCRSRGTRRSVRATRGFRQEGVRATIAGSSSNAARGLFIYVATTNAWRSPRPS